MAKITSDSISNFDQSKETALLQRQGKPLHWPPVHHNLSGVEAPTGLPAGVRSAAIPAPGAFGAEGSDQSSVGTSSSTSESKPDKSGSSVPETGSSLQSPVQTTESLSQQGQTPTQAPSSSAGSASGSTQETGASQPDPSNSSEGQQTEPASGTAAATPPSGRDLIHQARAAYEAQDWNTARVLLAQAGVADPSLNDEVNLALQAVQTASEATPSAGGFLVQ